MVIVVGCGLLLGAAVGLTFRWRGERVVLPGQPEGADGPPPIGWLLRAYVWLVCLGAIAGLLAGLLVVGPGGRLAMRILAATSPDAQGQLTDASEVVGRITLSGTVAFFVFVGLGAGVISGVVYVLLHRALPTGPLGGGLLGILLLIIIGTRVDPMRPQNRDFEILGPGWLAIALFTILAVATGAFVAAAAGRMSRALPLTGWASLPYVVPLGLLLVPVLVFAWPLGVLVLAGGVVFVTLGRLRAPSAEQSRRRMQALQAAVALLVLASLPGFVSAIADIAP